MAFTFVDDNPIIDHGASQLLREYLGSGFGRNIKSTIQMKTIRCVQRVGRFDLFLVAITYPEIQGSMYVFVFLSTITREPPCFMNRAEGPSLEVNFGMMQGRWPLGQNGVEISAKFWF
jgi:hypothetical protein